MRARRLFLVLALIAAALPGPAPLADIRYRTEIVGAGDGGLADLLDDVSELKSLEDRPPVSEEALRRRADRDLGRLEDAARSLGWWGAKFSFDIDTKAEPATVTVTVEPGPLYHVGSIEILRPDGRPLAMPAGEVQLPLRPGDPARTAPVVAAENALVAAFGNAGHPFAKAGDRHVVIDHAALTMDVTYTLDPGPVMHFGPVAVEGLDRLDPGYVERRLRWQPGQLYDATQVDETRRALIESGLFSTVRITPSTDLGNPGEVRMTVVATERAHRTVGAGIGYNTSQGVGARAFWENRNLFGNAEYLRLSGEVGQQIDGFRANFRRPDFLAVDQDLLATAEIVNDQPVAYHSRRALVSTGIERKFNRYLSGGIGLEAIRANVELLANTGTITAAERTQRYTLIGVPAYIKLDTTDDLLNPTRGWRGQLSVTPAHTISTPSLTFVTNLISASSYWRLGAKDRAIIAARVGLGSLDGAPSGAAPGRSADLCRRRRVGSPLRLPDGGAARCERHSDRRPVEPRPQSRSADQDHRHDRHCPVCRCRQLLRDEPAAAWPHHALRRRAGPALLYGVRAVAARSGDAAQEAQRRLADPGLCQPRPGLLMHAVVRLFRWFGIALGVVLAMLLAVFALVQTPVGKVWLAGAVARTVSIPDFRVSVEGLGGTVPFHMTVERIDIADADGVYLTLRNIDLDISAAALFTRRAQIRSLAIGVVEMARPSTAKSTSRLTDFLRVPHLPVAVQLDRLTIGRLALAPPVLGESVTATLTGSAAAAGRDAHIALDLHRIDGQAGRLALAMELTGAAQMLSLDLEASEPGGILADRLLGRSDHLPLAMSLKGKGPIADWRGRLTASVGPLARFDAELTLGVADETAAFSLSGTAAVAPLLPAELGPALGDRAALSLRATIGDRLVIDQLLLEAAAGTVTGDASFAGSEISANLRADVPNLSPLSGLLGTTIEGSATLTATVGGNRDRPVLDANLSGADIRLHGSGARRVTAGISAKPAGDTAARIALTAAGRIEQLVMPEGVALPAELGRDIDWSIAATAARDIATVDLTEFSMHGAGVDLAGSGHLGEGGQATTGRLSLSIADLRPFAGIVGRAIAGAVKLTADAERQGAAGLQATLEGSATGLRTGVAAADALLGGRATLTGAARRDADGRLMVDRLALSGEAAAFSGAGNFSPASRHLDATLDLDLPQLAALGPALGMETAGALTAQVKLDGAIDRLALTGRIEGRGIAAAGARIDRLHLDAQIPDLSVPSGAIEGSFGTIGLDATLALTAETGAGSELILPRLRLAAAGGAVEGSLRIALDTGLIRGSLSGRMPDLTAWSRLAGMPLAGAVEFSAGLDARGGQALDLTASGTRLAIGAGSSRLGVGRLQAQASLADLRGLPTGAGRLSLATVSSGAGDLAAMSLAFNSLRPGRFAFQGDAKGQPLTIAFAGDGGVEPGGIGLRLERFAGSLGSERFSLEQPLTMTRHNNDLAFNGLALRLGSGRIAGNGGVRGEALSLDMNAADLALAPVARMLGHGGARGALSFSANVGGTFTAPRGRLSVNASDLGFSAAKHGPGLGLAVTGDWNGRSIDLAGRVTGLQGDSMGLTGSIPLLLTRAPLGISVPPQGRLALRVQGAGQIDHLADLLPLGEDRLTGRFAVDVTVGGTAAAPDANGQATLSDARYENFASGAVLTGMRADLVGNRDRLTLTSLSAGDGASGKLEARGVITLAGGSVPSADLSGTLTNFRIAARDEAVVSASGQIAAVGPLSGPKVTAPLTIDRADINLPQRLPPNVVVLQFVEVNHRAGRGRRRRLRVRRQSFRRGSTSRSTCRGGSSCAGMGSTANGAAGSLSPGPVPHRSSPARSNRSAAASTSSASPSNWPAARSSSTARQSSIRRSTSPPR